MKNKTETFKRKTVIKDIPHPENPTPLKKWLTEMSVKDAIPDVHFHPILGSSKIGVIPVGLHAIGYNPAEKARWLAQLEKDEYSWSVNELGGRLHDIWRESRPRNGEKFEERWKETKDQSWIEEHGANKVDIANTEYRDLPSDWQAENEVSAKVAIDFIMK